MLHNFSFLKVLAFFVFFASEQKFSFGQEKTHEPKWYAGGTLGMGLYAPLAGQNEVLVNPYSLYKYTAEVGVNILFDISEKFFIKSGIYTTAFRSPFVDNVSVYDEFLKVPVLFSWAAYSEFKENSRLAFSGGPQISVLARQGRANRGDEHYSILSKTFGKLYKFGFTGEIAVYTRKNKRLHSYGFYCSSDIPPFYIKTRSDIAVQNHYVTVGLFYSYMWH